MMAGRPALGAFANGALAHALDYEDEHDAVLLEVGSRRPIEDACDYPDIDMVLPEGADRYFHRDGTAYPKHDRRT